VEEGAPILKKIISKLPSIDIGPESETLVILG